MASENSPAPRRGLGQRIYYNLARTGAMIIGIALFRYRRFGLHNIPKRGGCLIVANHQSYLDPPFLGMCVYTRQFHPMARGGLFRSRLLRPALRGLNSLPVGQGAGETAAMKKAIQLLRAGEVVLIFPEGSRSPDGTLQPFMRGAALLIRRAGCPVVPAAIEGAFEAWPRGRRPRLWGNRVGVEVGAPIDHADLMSQGADEAMRRLREEIKSLRRQVRRRLRAADGRESAELNATG